MRYPWPFEQPDPVLQASLDIALSYLEATKQAYPYSMTEVVCARIILDEWLVGSQKCRHRIWLANKAHRRDSDQGAAAGTGRCKGGGTALPDLNACSEISDADVSS